jgi:hypothetical protein
MCSTSKVAAVAVILGLSASIASAQSRPYGGDDPLTGGMTAMATNPSSPIYNYPAAEVQAVPPAKAAAAVARAVQNREYATLSGAVRNTVRSFEKSEDLQKAIAAEDEAWSAYEKAREAALRDLRNDPKYQAQVELANNLKTKIAERHAAPKPKEMRVSMPDPGITAMASLRFDYASAARARETEALSGSDAVRDAKQRLVEARSRVTQLREQMSEQVRTDDQIVAARKSYWDAKINRLGAEAYLSGVLEARSIALNYVYFINKYNKYGQRYQYAGGYEPAFGHGYGYAMYPDVPR